MRYNAILHKETHSPQASENAPENRRWTMAENDYDTLMQSSPPPAPTDRPPWSTARKLIVSLLVVLGLLVAAVVITIEYHHPGGLADVLGL
jgi:hypothetical protein